MSKLRRLVILVIFGLSVLIVLDKAHSIEQTRSDSSVASTSPVDTADHFD